MRTVGRALRLNFLKLMRIRDSAHRVALGFAIGIAIGCIPFFGIQTILALALAFVFGVNKAACVIGSVWTNPLTAFPVYYSCYRIGLVICRQEGLSFEDFSAILASAEKGAGLMALGADLFTPLIAGCVFAAVVLSPVAYLSVLTLISRYRQKKARTQTA